MSNNPQSRARIPDAAALAVEQDIRLKACGVAYHENQTTSRGYVGPPVHRLDGAGPKFTVQPLNRVEPKPGMEIHATDGEKYTLSLNFAGTWFDVVSPKGKRLIE